jgi:hypothetical protein
MPLTKITTDSLSNANVTSPKLASNLIVSLTRIVDESNVNTIGVGGNVDIDVSNSTVFFFNANTTANVTFNLRANATHTFDSATTIGETTSVAIAVKHGTVRHEANLHIDGVLQTVYYAANTKPANVSISNGEINLFSYSVFKIGSGSYTVISGNTLFGLG